MPEEIHVGDVIRTRKKHPCGSDEWTVTRNGADIKMKCGGCGRVVMLDRETFLKRRKALLVRGTGDTFPRTNDSASPAGLPSAGENRPAENGQAAL